MRSRIASASTALLLMLGLVALVACQGQDAEDADPAAALWSEIQEIRPELTKLRQEVADLEAQLKAAGEDATDEAAGTTDEAAEGAEDATAPMTPEELEAKIAEVQEQATKVTDEYASKLVEYINASDIVEGQPLTAEQRQAFDWKAEEDIRIAQEYIDKGGDYSRAISIYEQFLRADPDSELLQAAKAEAERLQYMDEERFSQVEKDMSQDEVRALLGTPNPRNVREYPERNTVGWFYVKAGGAGAAGVFFEETKKDNGNWRVIATDFDAVKQDTEGDEG